MSTSTVREIVRRKRKEYLKAPKAQKKRILDEAQGLTGYHRKSLARMFRKGVGPRKARIRRTRGRSRSSLAAFSTAGFLELPMSIASRTRMSVGLVAPRSEKVNTRSQNLESVLHGRLRTAPDLRCRSTLNCTTPPALPSPHRAAPRAQ